MSLRLFVSHSSGNDPSLVQAVHDALEAAGYDVLLDKADITAGDQWRRSIHAFLADCHAAVILFSPRALASSWVLKEATVLAWRAALEPAFTLVPILLPGVSGAEFAGSRYEPLALGEVQHAAAADAATVAALVQAAVGPAAVAGDTPFGLLRVAIADQLATVGDGLLEAAAARYLGLVQWVPGESRKRAFADRMARAIFTGADDEVLPRALQLLDAVRAPPEAKANVVELLAPLWVEPDAAGLIPPVAGRRVPQRDVALNGAVIPQFTARMYVSRAYPLSSLWKLVTVEDGNVGDFASHVAGRVRDAFRAAARALRGLPDAKVDEVVRGFRHPLFILLPRVPPRGEDLEALRSLYPGATFIIPTEQLPSPELLAPGVRPLVPELDLAREWAVFSAYTEAEALGFAGQPG